MNCPWPGSAEAGRHSESGCASAGLPHPKHRLVSVFRIGDPGLLPLATMALDEAGIEYLLKHAGKGDSFEWMMSQPPTNRPIEQEILVASDVADEARAGLGDRPSVR